MAQRPFWLAQALATGEGDPAPALESDTDADLCIVGGGFTGLWTAILVKRARPELDVVVLEADTCGAGASGRNGGCVLTWSTKFFTLRRLFGEAEAVRLVRASEKAVTDIEAFCTEHGIECEWRRHGTLFTATSQAQLGASDAVISALEACGIHSWQRVPLPQLQRQSGSRAHLEGWYSPQAATVQPGKLVRGLRRVALAMGIRLHEQTPMIRLQEDSPPVVHTPRGKVKARKVVIAINAWMARTFPEFERSVAIVSSDMVITEPAPQSLEACGLDRRHFGAGLAHIRPLLPQHGRRPADARQGRQYIRLWRAHAARVRPALAATARSWRSG